MLWKIWRKKWKQKYTEWWKRNNAKDQGCKALKCVQVLWKMWREKNRNTWNDGKEIMPTIRGARDYGMLQCFASNSVGHQTKPCTATIIPSGKICWRICFCICEKWTGWYPSRFVGEFVVASVAVFVCNNHQFIGKYLFSIEKGVSVELYWVL